MTGTVRFDLEGPIGVITNDNVEKRNAFDDAMDAELFEILDELSRRRDVRAVVWRGEGPIWSSGRDVSIIGTSTGISHHEMMRRGHAGILRVFEIDAPIIVALRGWAIGGSFQRALLCDLRIASEGTHMMLPELGHGVIPDTGGVARLFQMCGHGVVSDMVLTGRTMDAVEALGHGVISRIVPDADLDTAAMDMAEKIAAAPTVTVKLGRRVISRLAEQQVRDSMGDEMIFQTFLNRSDDFAEFKAAMAEGRPPRYTGS